MRERVGETRLTHGLNQFCESKLYFLYSDNIQDPDLGLLRESGSGSISRFLKTKFEKFYGKKIIISYYQNLQNIAGLSSYRYVQQKPSALQTEHSALALNFITSFFEGGRGGGHLCLARFGTDPTESGSNPGTDQDPRDAVLTRYHTGTLHSGSLHYILMTISTSY